MLNKADLYEQIKYILFGISHASNRNSQSLKDEASTAYVLSLNCRNI